MKKKTKKEKLMIAYYKDKDLAKEHDEFARLSRKLIEATVKEWHTESENSEK